jgi:hypothetical protein
MNEIVLKVALNTITLTLYSFFSPHDFSLTTRKLGSVASAANSIKEILMENTSSVL